MKILIFGGTGTIGKALIEKYYKDNKIIIYSRDEYKQWELKKKYPDIKTIVGDIGKKINIKEKYVNYIINCAAMKHVSFCMENPKSAIDINIKGCLNILKFYESLEHCKSIVHISSDKAVEPHNLYGATKLIGEELFNNAMQYLFGIKVCRLVNVFGSRGSVVPYFLKLKKQNIKTVPISDINSRRYFVSIKDAADFIGNAMMSSKEGLHIMRGKLIYIKDLAKIINPECELTLVGMRPGEKLIEKIDLNERINIQEEYTKSEIIEMLNELED